MATDPRLSQLDSVERQVLVLTAAGLNPTEVAKRLGYTYIAVRTIMRHVQAVTGAYGRKLRVYGATHLAQEVIAVCRAENRAADRTEFPRPIKPRHKDRALWLSWREAGWGLADVAQLSGYPTRWVQTVLLATQETREEFVRWARERVPEVPAQPVAALAIGPIPKRRAVTGRLRDEVKAAVVADYKRDVPLRPIADALGRSYTWVQNLLDEADVPRRPQGRRVRGTTPHATLRPPLPRLATFAAVPEGVRPEVPGVVPADVRAQLRDEAAPDSALALYQRLAILADTGITTADLSRIGRREMPTEIDTSIKIRVGATVLDICGLLQWHPDGDDREQWTLLVDNRPRAEWLERMRDWGK